MSNNDHSWHVIYPAYINSNRTLARGRRVPKTLAVPDPKWQEIKDILENHKAFKVEPQANKIYPRELDKETPVYQGRVLYQVDPNEKQFANKEAVLKYVGSMIPKLKSRQAKSGADGGAAGGSGGTQSGGQTGSGSGQAGGGKKGKKGKR